MRSHGGFAWRYVDLVNEHGDGVVMIWSFGLPFLPGGGPRKRAAERPAFNIAVYRDGQPAFYLLQELEPDEVSATSARWRFAQSTLMLRRSGGALELVADLDAPVPGTRRRLRGTVRVVGSACRVPGTASDGCPHTWSPLAMRADGRARLSWCDKEVFELSGRAYVDANASTHPLHELGIRDWSWGRVGIGARELVYYQVRSVDGDAAPITYAFIVSSSGAMQPVGAPTLTMANPRRSLYGLTHHRELHLRGVALDVAITSEALVDDGPFYQRALTRAVCRRSGATGRGMAELVVPERVDVPWQRPFVRMRRHAIGGDNSMWLPLFSGERRGRVGRLLSSLFTREART